MTTFAPATNLDALSLDELFVELIWLEEQVQTMAIRDAFVKCWNAIAARQARIADWNDFLAG
jgi:hypothetical protein